MLKLGDYVKTDDGREGIIAAITVKKLQVNINGKKEMWDFGRLSKIEEGLKAGDKVIWEGKIGHVLRLYSTSDGERVARVKLLNNDFAMIKEKYLKLKGDD